MKNIAIVIGVTNYQRLTKLSGSKNDAENIRKILELTGKYEEILYLNDDKFSVDIKEEIVLFFEKYKSAEIEEFFFYFSGHGEFLSDEFCYLLVDFDRHKKTQTSIQNIYIDNLIRSISPKLTIKVIDACQSGTQYIKSSDTLNEYLNNTKSQLKNCYFLFSSHSDQSSFQSKYISHFTNSFINALKTHTKSEIRYINITEYIADEFSENVEQKPLFISQAENTEKFCTINGSLKQFLDDYTGNAPSAKTSDVTKSTLASLVIKDAEQYCSLEDAHKIIGEIKNKISNFQLDSEISSLYKYEITFLDSYTGVLEINTLANFIDKYKNENNYFVKINYDTKEVEEAIYSQIPFNSADLSVIHPGNIQTGVRMKNVNFAKDFELTFDTPYKSVNIDIIPLYDNLIAYNAKILYVISRKYIRFFTSLNNYIEESWDSKILNPKVKWNTEEHPLKDENALNTFLASFNASINQYILAPLNEKFETVPKNEETPKKKK